MSIVVIAVIVVGLGVAYGVLKQKWPKAPKAQANNRLIDRVGASGPIFCGCTITDNQTLST